MIVFAEVWGGGRGPVGRLAPHVRLICGTLVFVCCSLAPLHEPAARVLVIGVLAGWVAGCGLPRQRLAAVCGLAACLYLPVILFAAAVRLPADPAAGHDVWRVAGLVGVRGAACVAVAAATMATLDLSHLRQALDGLPLPHAAGVIILQIAHQTALLTDETRRITAALRVRGAASAGMRTRLRVLCALPVIWLLRLTLRAGRVGAAMEVRGFDGTIRRGSPVGTGLADHGAVALVSLALGVIVWLRWRGV